MSSSSSSSPSFTCTTETPSSVTSLLVEFCFLVRVTANNSNTKIKYRLPPDTLKVVDHWRFNREKSPFITCNAVFINTRRTVWIEDYHCNYLFFVKRYDFLATSSVLNWNFFFDVTAVYTFRYWSTLSLHVWVFIKTNIFFQLQSWEGLVTMRKTLGYRWTDFLIQLNRTQFQFRWSYPMLKDNCSISVI